MIRFGASNLAVLALAVGASLSTAWWLTHLDGRGPAHAATPSPVVAQSRLAPPAGPTQVLRGPDGHWWAEARIDGRAVRLMVDTGASVVALTREDAARLGLDLTPADFSAEVATASGPVGAARVTLDRVSVGTVEVRNVDAVVVEDGLPHSLLGMSWLGRLSGFEATPEALTLRP